VKRDPQNQDEFDKQVYHAQVKHLAKKFQANMTVVTLETNASKFSLTNRGYVGAKRRDLKRQQLWTISELEEEKFKIIKWDGV
jgi:hypothetical protein